MSTRNKDGKGDKSLRVNIRECPRGRKWVEGCKRCTCDSRSRKHCDDSSCPKLSNPLKENAIVEEVYDVAKQGEAGEGSRGAFQRPPQLKQLRRHGVRPNFRQRLLTMCGEFKVGDQYWDVCNLCLCTPHGPKCTAASCA